VHTKCKWPPYAIAWTPPWKFSAYAADVYSKVWVKSNLLKYPSVCLEISFFSILLRRQLSPVPTPSPTKAISPTTIKRPLNNGHRDDIRPKTSKHYWSGSSRFTLSSTRGVQDLDFRTRDRQDSAHFEQTGSDPDYGFIHVFGSGSGFSNFFFWYLTAKQT